MEMEVEGVSGGEYSSKQNREHKDSVVMETEMENRQSVKVSKTSEGSKVCRREVKLKKPEKHDLKYE